MLFDFLDPVRHGQRKLPEFLELASSQVTLKVIRHPHARRYMLRLKADGTIRLTIPRSGSTMAAWQFLRSNHQWLENQFRAWQSRQNQSIMWQVGSTILFRGREDQLELVSPELVRLGNETFVLRQETGDFRPILESHFRKIAVLELPIRVDELAAQYGFKVNRITVRNQRTRWGSCSQRGNISLNWRLIQTPNFVRDYIILHELAHLRHMNHSESFWNEVKQLCPDFKTAEFWLKQHHRALRQ